jgi:hypothetical protein
VISEEEEEEGDRSQEALLFYWQLITASLPH